jgi:glycosyltransferase involved in cell wall biosynthesis
VFSGVGNCVEVSVVMPTLNVGTVVQEQLEALAKQTCDTVWELIVADNGSHDSTLAVLASNYDKLPNMRVIDASGRRGTAYARNLAAQQANGRSLLFVDADDRVAPGWLAAMVTALRIHSFVACRLEHDLLNPPWTRGLLEHPQTTGLVTGDFLPSAFGPTIGIHRSLHDSIGGFDETNLGSEDTDYCWRVQLRRQ